MKMPLAVFYFNNMVVIRKKLVFFASFLIFVEVSAREVVVTSAPAPAAESAQPVYTSGQIQYCAMRTHDQLVGDIWRLRWHPDAPDARWHDLNGTFEIDGQCHLGFLRFVLQPGGTRLNKGKAAHWGHATSRDPFHA
jgi:hypothetical protein